MRVCGKVTECGVAFYKGSADMLLWSQEPWRQKAARPQPTPRSPALGPGPTLQQGPDQVHRPQSQTPALVIYLLCLFSQALLAASGEGLSQKKRVWSQGDGVHAKSPLCFNE